MEIQGNDNENTYTAASSIKCPKNNRDAIHTVTYKKATCTRVDDIILNFHCSQDAQCLECQLDYL